MRGRAELANEMVFNRIQSPPRVASCGARSPVLERAGMLFCLSVLCIAARATGMGCLTTPARAAAPFDVIHYDARVEPDIARKTITGKVLIRLAPRAAGPGLVEFDCGDLIVDAVHEGGQAQKFSRTDRRLAVMLSRPAVANETREIEIDYHGAPRFGVRFFPERTQVYTVFSTSQWLVCVDAPEDRATLRLNLILPAGLRATANGRLIAQRTLPGDKVSHEWRQNAPVPTYTFGFAAGPFQEIKEKRGRVQFNYLAAQFSGEELRKIFRDTAGMLSFYEDRSGVAYADSTYTQVLAAGGVEQEMSGFTVMRETYGGEVLADERAVWLAAHEMAHQWWGNKVTCRDWTHFWLNEGLATFMAAAYKEHRFGRPEYMREIEESRARYQKVRDAGKDRSLVFSDWAHPTADDRALVYHKGAYVLHLLRGELGERAFWAGIRHYTRTYFGRSVTTIDFQRAMEHAAGKSLTDFFARWVYLTER
jgi:aminopeptidase N